MGILVTQKNELFRVIQQRGLRPTEFELTEERDSSYVRHKSSDSFFSLASTDGVGYYGEAKLRDYGPYPYAPMYWHELLNDAFARWAYNLKVELQTPDMWTELRNSIAFLGETADDVENTRFSDNELKIISEQLLEIKNYIAESRALSTEQTAKLEARFDEAERASQRMGRKDWIMLFGGTLFSLVLSAIVPPDVILHVVSMTANGLQQLFGGSGMPALPPQS